jgi:hypothetical protein
MTLKKITFPLWGTPHDYSLLTSNFKNEHRRHTKYLQEHARRNGRH